MHVKNTKPYIPQEDINPLLKDIQTALETGNLTLVLKNLKKNLQNTQVQNML